MTPPARRTEVKKAEKLLTGLLGTPKTRAGLVAAVADSGLSKHYIFGWLGDQLRKGLVVELKASKPATFQMAHKVIAERPSASIYPAWLGPRELPVTFSRRAYIDGRSVGTERNRPTK